MSQTYPAHPLAETLPLLEGVEFDELVASIRKNGQRDPITLYDGKILDGRNRYRACTLLGIEPIFEVLDPEDGLAPTDEMLADYVYDRNVMRRQLTPSQRAMAAGKLLSYSGVSRNAANMAAYAERAGVSPKTVQDAVLVATRAPSNVVNLVERGEVAVSRAANVVRGKLSEDELVPKREPRPAGRPVGNMHVLRLRNLIEDFDQLRTGRVARGETVSGVIVRHWDSDPKAARTVSEMASWLRSLARELEEVERVAAENPSAVA